MDYSYFSYKHLERVRKEIAGKLQEGVPVLAQDVLLYSDFLIVQILFRNPHRGGVISNIKMRYFRKGRNAVVDNTHVMKVRIHKTHRKYGDANIVIDEALWTMALHIQGEGTATDNQLLRNDGGR